MVDTSLSTEYWSCQRSSHNESRNRSVLSEIWLSWTAYCSNHLVVISVLLSAAVAGPKDKLESE